MPPARRSQLVCESRSSDCFSLGFRYLTAKFGIKFGMRKSAVGKTRPKPEKQDALVICAVALCFLITLAMCFIIDGEGFVAVVRSGSGDDETYYLLCGGAYENISLARNYADLIKARGGAGYVLAEEGSYQVILSVYSDSEDAQAALESSGMQGAYLLELTILNPSCEWAGDAKGEAEAALGYFSLAYAELNSLSRGVADGTLTLTDARTRLDVLRERISEIKADFYDATAEKSDNRHTEIKLALVTTVALLDNVSFSSPSGAESAAYACASMRYQQVQLVMCRKALGETLS